MQSALVATKRRGLLRRVQHSLASLHSVVVDGQKQALAMNKWMLASAKGDSPFGDGGAARVGGAVRAKLEGKPNLVAPVSAAVQDL